MTCAFDMGKNTFKFRPCWKMKTLKRFMWRINFLLLSFTMSCKVRNSTWPRAEGLWKYTFNQEVLVGKSRPNKTEAVRCILTGRITKPGNNSSHSYLKCLVVSGKEFFFFQAQTHFLLNLLFYQNLNVVRFPYM